MPVLKNPRHEAFAQALARGMSAAAAYGEVGFKPHRHNAVAKWLSNDVRDSDKMDTFVPSRLNEVVLCHPNGTVQFGGWYPGELKIKRKQK